MIRTMMTGHDPEETSEDPALHPSPSVLGHYIESLLLPLFPEASNEIRSHEGEGPYEPLMDISPFLVEVFGFADPLQHV